MASYRVQTPKPLLDHRCHSRMYVRFAQTGLVAACLFRRSHGAVALREGSLPSSVTPRPPRRAPTGSRVAWVFRLGSDDFCSCVGGPDGIASCVGFPGRDRELRGFSRTGSRAAWAVLPRKGESRPARPRKGESRPAMAEKATQRRIPSGAATRRRTMLSVT